MVAEVMKQLSSLKKFENTTLTDLHNDLKGGLGLLLPTTSKPFKSIDGAALARLANNFPEITMSLPLSVRGKLDASIRRVGEITRSKAWFYPIKGIIYFLTHPSLIRAVSASFAPFLMLSIMVTICMFMFTYPLQVLIFGSTNGPLAFINVFIIVMSESRSISLRIAKTMFLEKHLDTLFDRTLDQRGSTALAAARSNLSSPTSSFPWILVCDLKSLLDSTTSLALNFIPIVGTPLYIYFKGKKYGLTLNCRSRALRNVKDNEITQMENDSKVANSALGVPSLTLETVVPFLGVFFTYTNTVGAALWTHDEDIAAPLEDVFDDLEQWTEGTLQVVAREAEKTSEFVVQP